MFVILLQNSFQKFVFKLNHTFILLLVRFFITSQQCMKIIPVLTLELLASGVAVIIFSFLMLVFLIFADSIDSTNLAATLHKHEGEKRCACEEHVR